jgi:hypothetical protein
MHNKLHPVHLMWGLLQVCAACPTPCLNQRFKLRPCWHNIHDTFPTGTAQDASIETQTYSLPDSEHIHTFIDTRERDDFVNAFLQCNLLGVECKLALRHTPGVSLVR